MENWKVTDHKAGMSFFVKADSGHEAIEAALAKFEEIDQQSELTAEPIPDEDCNCVECAG